MPKQETEESVSSDIQERAALVFQCEPKKVTILPVGSAMVACDLHHDGRRISVELQNATVLERLCALRSAVDVVVELRRL